MIKIMLFAGLKEKLNREMIHYDQDVPITVGQLRVWLVKEYPELADDLKRVMIAVNESFAQDDGLIGPEDQVALIPPVSGG